jgi:DNA-binding FrmR family transcriptional regulator
MAAAIKTHQHGAGGPPRRKPRARPESLERELANRLKRAEGQLRGLGKMVAESTYCIDVLQQIAAVRRALDRIALILLHDHIETCVAEALAQPGARGKITELVDAIDRFLA